MAKMIPLVRGNSYYANPNGYIPFVRGNGFTTEDGSDEPEPTYETVGPVDLATFTVVRSAPLKSLVVTMEPQQDLHGYDNPWPAGGRG